MELQVQRFDDGMRYLLLPPDKGEQLRSAGHKRVLVTAQGSLTFHAALLFRKEHGYFVYISADKMRKLNLNEGDSVPIEVVPDTSKYQFEMPEVLQEVFDQDPEAFKVFQALTPGNQRGLMYLVTAVKSVDKQIERALKISEGLKIGVHSPRHILRK